jgi:hypothetical protein
MPQPEIVAYTASTGRALVRCGDYVCTWMTADEMWALGEAWFAVAADLRQRNEDVAP